MMGVKAGALTTDSIKQRRPEARCNGFLEIRNDTDTRRDQDGYAARQQNMTLSRTLRLK